MTINTKLILFPVLGIIFLLPTRMNGQGLPVQGENSDVDEVYDMRSRRELFIDRFLFDRSEGIQFQLHRPQPQEIVFTFDKPWERMGTGYATVLKDGGLYRMYYRALPDSVGNRDQNQVTCFTESTDGIHWTRPELGLYEIKGTLKNNIIARGPESHNFTPFIDKNPNCLPEERYKAVGGLERTGGLWLFVSPDGIHWKKKGDKPLPIDGYFDSQNVLFWDNDGGLYRTYWRDFRSGDSLEADGRDIRVAVSKDLVTWNEQKWLVYNPGRNGTADRGGEPHQLYTNGIRPYHRAPHLLLGFPTRYIDRGWTPSTDHLPAPEIRSDLAARGIAGGKPTRLGTAVTDVLLMSSRDGLTFFVWPKAFLPPGIQRPGTWFYGNGFLAWGDLPETESALKGAPRELSFYVREDSPDFIRELMLVRRYTIRLDGFVSVSASLDGGSFLTRPLRFEGNRLSVNFSTSAGGTLRVGIRDESGNPIAGYSMENCPLHYGDEIERVITWDSGEDLSQFAGRTVRLYFELKDAELFSIRFVD